MRAMIEFIMALLDLLFIFGTTTKKITFCFSENIEVNTDKRSPIKGNKTNN